MTIFQVFRYVDILDNVQILLQMNEDFERVESSG